jgi:hypothetical protein
MDIVGNKGEMPVRQWLGNPIEKQTSDIQV